MYRRAALSVLALVLGLGSLADAATIVWVSDNKTPSNNVPADQAWVDLLTAQGYTVDLSFRNKEARTLDATKIAALKQSDITAQIKVSGLAAGEYQLAPEITLPPGFRIVKTEPQTFDVIVK